MSYQKIPKTSQDCLSLFAVTVCQQRGSAEGCESWAKHSGHCNKVLPFPSLFLRNKVGCCMAGLHAIRHFSILFVDFSDFRISMSGPLSVGGNTGDSDVSAQSSQDLPFFAVWTGLGTLDSRRYVYGPDWEAGTDCCDKKEVGECFRWFFMSFMHRSSLASSFPRRVRG